MAQRSKRNPANKLERWEISLIKRLIASTAMIDQDILAYFTRPTRSINHARIAEIRSDAHVSQEEAKSDALIGLRQRRGLDRCDRYIQNGPAWI